MVRNFRWSNTLLPAMLVMLVVLTACGSAADAPTATTVPAAPTAAPAQDVPMSAPTTAAPDAAAAAPTMDMTSTPPTTMPTDAATAPAAGALTTAPTPAPTFAPAAGASGTVVQATLREWGLDLSQTTVPAGPVHFVVTNTGRMGHNFTIKGSGGVLGNTPLFTPDQGAQTLDITLAAGTYTVYCSLPGHAARGQQNTLVVK